MMNNFTPRAQQVLALARKEAERFNHNYVGTEHLLLGLIKLGQGVAVNVLEKMGLDLERVRMEVEKHVGSHPETNMIGNIPYTPRVKKVLALAGKEAQALNHSRRHAPGPVDLWPARIKDAGGIRTQFTTSSISRLQSSKPRVSRHRRWSTGSGRSRLKA